MTSEINTNNFKITDTLNKLYCLWRHHYTFKLALFFALIILIFVNFGAVGAAQLHQLV